MVEKSQMRQRVELRFVQRFGAAHMPPHAQPLFYYEDFGATQTRWRMNVCSALTELDLTYALRNGKLILLLYDVDCRYCWHSNSSCTCS